MKKTINGIRYDTNNAVLIGEYNHGSLGSINFTRESLYITPRSKTYFLAGIGGPNTKYGIVSDNKNRISGEKILPLSRKSAFEWAKEYLDPCIAEFFLK